jgi:hypothetical protein
MTILAGVLGGAMLFVIYGLMMRGRRARAGQGCSCGAIFGSCGSCQKTPDPMESDHDRR